MSKSTENPKGTPKADMSGLTQAEVRDQSKVFQEILDHRRSIRIYDGKPLPESVMQSCLDAALLAPSSSNLQAFELYWVKSPEKKALLAKYCLGQPAATTAGDLVVVVARSDLWKVNLDRLVGIMTANGQKLAPPVEKYYLKQIPSLYRNDPFGIMNFGRRLLFAWMGRNKPMVRTPVSQADHRIYGHVQATLVAQTLMLAISAHGYDSCPMGGIDEFRIKKLLGLKSKAEVTMVISAGTRKPEGVYGPRIRFKKSDLVKEI